MVERFIRTMKDECTRRMVVPLRREAMRAELQAFIHWFNEYRAHMTLSGRTPNEAYFPRVPGNQAPRTEPRSDWPTDASCARPEVPARAAAGGHFGLDVTYHAGRKHLPVIRLERVA